MELSSFFPVPERASEALDQLRQAGFDADSASLVTGEDARTVLHKRLAATRRGRAFAGAVAAGGLSILLAAVVVVPAAEPFPWLLVASFVGLAALLGAAIGGYYGMGVEKESVLVGLVVPNHRMEEAVSILRHCGGRFILARKLADDFLALTRQRAPTMIRTNR